jgi:hypothetical protein
MIAGAGLRRLDFFATARRLFLGAARLITILCDPPGFLRRFRRGFMTVEPYPDITRPPPFGGFRLRAVACRRFGALLRLRVLLALSAAFWRAVPKCLICFALILRRAAAIVLPLPRRAGF